jgi:hypothetical protein
MGKALPGFRVDRITSLTAKSYEEIRATAVLVRVSRRTHRVTALAQMPVDGVDAMSR